MKITITIPIDEAERVLRQAARDAAFYGALVDHVTRRTIDPPAWERGKAFEDARRHWQSKFLAAKQLVECFGVEHEATSEAETLTIGYGSKPVLDKKGRQIVVMGLFRRAETDYDKRAPQYRRSVHEEACQQAAARVVRAWRIKIATEGKAA